MSPTPNPGYWMAQSRIYIELTLTVTVRDVLGRNDFTTESFILVLIAWQIVKKTYIFVSHNYLIMHQKQQFLKKLLITVYLAFHAECSIVKHCKKCNFSESNSQLICTECRVGFSASTNGMECFGKNLILLIL